MDEKIDILFFERPVADLKRYAFKIAEYIKDISPEMRLASISLELPENTEGCCIDQYYIRRSIRNIDKFLNEKSVQIIIFTNPRIPDMEMILHAQKLGIKTVLIQEGVIFSGSNINDVNIKNIVSLFGFLPKTIYYLYILKRICRYDNKNYLSLLETLLKEKENITSIVAHYFKPYLIADYVLTMGSYWESYYKNVMAYPKDRIRVIGDHDLDNFTPHNECESAICYIATLLVEEGTVSKKEFEKFIFCLAKCIDKKTKLYIKLHPRSDEKLYQILKDHNIEFIRNGKLPAVNVYISHRSTLIARALYESDNIIIWRFKRDKEDFFEKFARNVCRKESELNEAIIGIDINNKTNYKRKEMERYFFLNPNGSIKTAAQMILQYVKTNIIK